MGEMAGAENGHGRMDGGVGDREGDCATDYTGGDWMDEWVDVSFSFDTRMYTRIEGMVMGTERERVGW